MKNEVFDKKSLLGSYWELEECDERSILSSSQKNNISPLLAKLLLIRNIDDKLVNDYLYPNINEKLPDPFLLKGIEKAVERTIKAIFEKQKLGIIADYDVDGSTSASILYKFLNNFTNNIFVETPNRLSEGYGPNHRLMDQMLKKNVNLVFTLDCGTTSFDIIDNKKYSSLDVIVIDHHLSEAILPKVFSIINPNRFDENNDYQQMSAVGVTFLFLMALRKKLRISKYFNHYNLEPNLMNYLDLVALGTICDVVELKDYNRVFVKIGLDIIKQRKNKAISKMIDNSNINSTPTSTDLAFIIGPQINAASRIDDSLLPSKLLTSKRIDEIESISRKLLLLNEKRKLIENQIFEDAIIQSENQEAKNYILVYGKNWHNGVLGIVASRILSIYYKPTIVISFNGSLGLGSARSIKNIDLGNIILEAKNKKMLLSGGGHQMAAGFKIEFDFIEKFKNFIDNKLSSYQENLFKKIEKFDSVISINEINQDLLDNINQIEPFGSGNHEPRFIINDLKINKVQIIKEKHLLVFFINDFSHNIKGICFNCVGKIIGDYLLNFKNKKLLIGCTIKKDKFSENSLPQIIIKDVMLDE